MGVGGQFPGDWRWGGTEGEITGLTEKQFQCKRGSFESYRVAVKWLQNALLLIYWASGPLGSSSECIDGKVQWGGGGRWAIWEQFPVVLSRKP